MLFGDGLYLFNLYKKYGIFCLERITHIYIYIYLFIVFKHKMIDSNMLNYFNHIIIIILREIYSAMTQQLFHSPDFQIISAKEFISASSFSSFVNECNISSSTLLYHTKYTNNLNIIKLFLELVFIMKKKLF